MLAKVDVLVNDKYSILVLFISGRKKCVKENGQIN